MFCHNCGKEIKSGAKFCPYCGKAQHQKTPEVKPVQGSKTKKSDGKKQKLKKSRKKSKFVAVAIVLFVMAALAAVGYFFMWPKLKFFFQKKYIEQAAAAQAEALMSGDMDKINKLIFPLNDSIASFPDNSGIEQDESVLSAQPQSGESTVMQILFTNAQISVADVTRDTIQYSISAPDFSDFFEDYQESMSELSDEQEVFDLLSEYSSKVSKVQITLALTYTYEDGILCVEYQNQAFFNAISGGLFDAYANLYNQLINAYREELQGL